MCEKVNIRSDT